MKIGLRLATLFLIVALSLAPLAACGGAEPTETPTPTPTPTETPTPTPEPPANAINADLLGQTVIIGLDDSGAFAEAVEVTSADGIITLKFAAGTILKDSDGNVVKELSAEINPTPQQPDDGAAILGPTLTFRPNSASIEPALAVEYDYSGFAAQIAAVENAEVYMARWVNSFDTWAKFFDSAVDADAKIAAVPLNNFVKDFAVACMAVTPLKVERATGPPANGVDLTIESQSEFRSASDASITVKTQPGAHVLCWIENPGGFSRSSRPEDRYREADENGLVTWNFDISMYVSRGEGHFEFYVTTSTDTDFLAAFQANRLETIYPDKAADIKKFQEGRIEQLEIDDQTTLKLYPFVVTGVGTETSTPTPTPAPTETPAEGAVHTGDVPLEFTFVSPDPVLTNSEIEVTVKTEPGAEVKLEMWLSNDQKSSFPKDSVHTADENGVATWKWILFRATYSGQTKLQATATKDGKTGITTTYFEAKKE